MQTLLAAIGLSYRQEVGKCDPILMLYQLRGITIIVLMIHFTNRKIYNVVINLGARLKWTLHGIK